MFIKAQTETTKTVTHNDLYTEDQRINTGGYDAIALLIASHLEGWEVTTKDKEGASNRYRYLTDGTYTIRLSVDPSPNRHAYLNPRVNIRGDYWYNGKNITQDIDFILQNKGTDGINVALHRGFETVAKEIQKRLLPVFIPQFDSATRKLKRYEQIQNNSKKLAQDLADYMGTEVDRLNSRACKQRQANLNDSLLSFWCDENGATATIYDLSPDTAKALIDWLKARVN